jgi:hypothetical protein
MLSPPLTKSVASFWFLPIHAKIIPFDHRLDFHLLRSHSLPFWNQYEIYPISWNWQLLDCAYIARYEIAIRSEITILPPIWHREKLDHKSRQERQAIHDKTETLSYFKHTTKYNANLTNPYVWPHHTPTFRFLTTDEISINETRNINALCQVTLARPVDPTEPSCTSPDRQLVQGTGNELKLPQSRASSQLLLVE